MRKRPQAPRGAIRSSETLQNGHAIREFREWARWSVTSLATAVGISHSTLSNIEAERRSTNEEIIDKIAKTLKVDPRAIKRERDDVASAEATRRAS